MRQFNKVSTTVWDSRKFRTLDDDSKLAYLYLLTSPQNNSAGCFNLSIGFAVDHLGWEPERFRKAIERLSKAYLIDYDEPEKTVLLTNWFTFNIPTNPKHASGTIKELKLASSPRLKFQAVQSFAEILTAKNYFNDKDFRKTIESLSEAFRKAIATETETETEIQKETQNKTEIEKKTERFRTVDTRAREASEGPRLRSSNGADDVETAEAAYADEPTEENWTRLQAAINRRNSAA